MDWQYGEAQCRIPHGLPAPHIGLRNFMNEVISLMLTCPLPPNIPAFLLPSCAPTLNARSHMNGVSFVGSGLPTGGLSPVH